MGLNIGRVAATFLDASVTRSGGTARGQEQPAPDVARQNPAPAGELAESSGSSVPGLTFRAGFGEGTVSIPGALLDLVGRGVRAARLTVPSFTELRADLRADAGEARTELVAEAEELRERAQDSRESGRVRIPAAQLQAFTQFNETRAPAETEGGTAEPVRFSSATPPEAPDFASAPDIDERDLPETQPAPSVNFSLAPNERGLDLNA